jgi:hypothetical protein
MACLKKEGCNGYSLPKEELMLRGVRESKGFQLWQPNACSMSKCTLRLSQAALSSRLVLDFLPSCRDVSHVLDEVVFLAKFTP